MSICFIGVDAGGTTTKVQAFTYQGEVIVSDVFGPGSVANSLNAALNNIETGIRTIVNKVKDQYEIAYIVVGISGIASYPKLAELKAYYEKEFSSFVEITSDASIALSSITTNTGQNGILVLSGTGIVVYGNNGNRSQMIGGWGFHLYEKGSAFSVVHKCALSAIGHYEKGMELSPLEKGLLQAMGLDHISGLRRFFYQENPKEHVASHASYLKKMAKQNDEQAILILKEAGIELAMQVIDLVNLLKLENNTLLGLRGGFFMDAEIVIDSFNRSLNEKGYQFKMVPYDDPIKGAYYQALDLYQQWRSK